MNLSPSPTLPTSPLQPVVLRMNVPWYRDVPVIADPFGSYNVQFSATFDGESTRVHIAAFPTVIKKTRDLPGRPICPLSGSYETQPEVIAAWENGFVVTALNDERPQHLARAVVKYLLKNKLAEEVKL